MRTASPATTPAAAHTDFARRAETFGFDRGRPWALPALRLLASVPRAYTPLVAAWDRRHPGVRRALSRLGDLGFAAYQPPVIVDTRTAAVAGAESRRVRRWRTTAKGSRLAGEAGEDLRVLEDRFPRLTPANVKGVAALIAAYDLDGSHARHGLSMAHATQLSGLAPRTARWWTRHLAAQGYLRELDARQADVRAVVPAHWRLTRALCKQLLGVIDAFDAAPDSLASELRLRRDRFLGDIDPTRVGISGATDYDHDVEAQRILAAMLSSSRCAAEGVFSVEPRLVLPADTDAQPWAFVEGGGDWIPYQPDAELRERDADGSVVRSVVEYERFQSRRDAWGHIERFLGHLATRSLPFEPAVLRFVVDSESRVRSYVELIEAFGDHALDSPELLPANPTSLAVSSVERVLAAADPLDARAWFRIQLPTGGDSPGRPVLHPAGDSPYDEYFARTPTGLLA